MTTPASDCATNDGAKLKCQCCSGRKVVEGIDGTLRPCSRCNDVAFLQWIRDRATRTSELSV